MQVGDGRCFYREGHTRTEGMLEKAWKDFITETGDLASNRQRGQSDKGLKLGVESSSRRRGTINSVVYHVNVFVVSLGRRKSNDPQRRWSRGCVVIRRKRNMKLFHVERTTKEKDRSRWLRTEGGSMQTGGNKDYHHIGRAAGRQANI